jgi:hypothetical protein
MLTLRSANLICFVVWSVGLVKTFNSAVNLLGHDIVWEEDKDTKYMVTVYKALLKIHKSLSKMTT